METLLLLIGLATAACVTLLSFGVYRSLAYPARITRARMLGNGMSPVLLSPLLREQRLNPLLRLIPVLPGSSVRTSAELDQAGWNIRVHEYMALRLLSLVLGAFVGLWLTGALSFEGTGPALGGIVLGGVAGWLLPRLGLNRARRRRLARIERQLPDALLAMAKALKAGTGLLNALARAAEDTPAPLGPELRVVLRDLQLGAEPQEVFGALSERVGSPDLDIAVTAIVIQRNIGGNLSEILSNVANTVRERAKLRGEINVLTSRQRLTGNLAAMVPVVIAVAFIAINPDIGKLILETTTGKISAAIGIGFELMGVWLIRRLAIIDI
jgi:tight adherence protein B